jgi:hypothetical protein
MKLIEFDGLELKVADEAFLIRQIRQLFEADKSKKKEQFWKQMSYLWFMCDPRSTYQYITDETNRSLEIKAQEGFSVDWEPTDTLKEAMDIYRKHTVTTSALLLEGMRKGIDKLSTFLGNTEISEKTVAAMTSALRQIPELAKALVEAEKSLAKDFATDENARGNAVKAIGEDL